MQDTRWKQRVLGAMLALLVQAGFALLVLLSPSHQLRLSSLPPETILIFPPLAAPIPSTIDARGPRKRRTSVPSFTPVPPPIVAPPAATAPLTPPSGLAGFGRSLFACTPENYALLAPDERAHCPKPGEGLAKNDDRDLIAPARSHARLEAMWQEQWREDHWAPAPCLPDPAGMVVCVLRQSIAENRRAAAARQKITDDKAAALAVKPSPPPDSIRSSPRQ